MPVDPGTGSRTKRKRSKPPSKQAVIWAAEQNLRPWEVDRLPKAKPPKRTVPYKPGAEPRRAPLPLPTITQQRYELAKKAPVDLAARKELARTLTPARRKELERDVRRKPGLMMTSEELRKARGKGKLWNPLRSLKSGIDYVSRVGRQGTDALYDILLTEEEQAEVAETLRASTATASTGAQAISGVVAPGVEQSIRRDAKAMGFGSDESEAIAEAAGNLVRNVSEGVVGFAPGVATLAAHPRQMGGEIAGFYRDFYAPLVQGDTGTFLQNLKENPDMLLDFLGTGGLVAGTGRRAGLAGRVLRDLPSEGTMIESAAEARAAREAVGRGRGRAAAGAAISGKVPKRLLVDEAGEPVYGVGKPVYTRRHVIEGEETSLQRYVPQGAIGLAGAEALERLRGVPRIGESRRQARFRKGVREDVEATRSRVFGELQAFRAAGRNVQDNPTLAKAFDRALIYGGDPALVAQRIRREIDVRQREGLNESQSEIEELHRLNEAAAFLESGASPDFQRVVDQGRSISADTENFLKQAGLLTEATAERMLMMPAQFLEDVPAVASPQRDRMQAMLEQRWPRDEDGNLDPMVDVAMRYLDANAISWSRRNELPPEAFYSEVYADASYAKSGDVYDVLGQPGADVLTQRGDPTPFLISEARARQHRRAHEELRGMHGPERQAAALERARPKHVGRITTIKQRFDRIFDQIPDVARQKEIARWYKDVWPVFERYFGEDAAAGIRAFLASQAAQSPAGGLSDMLKILEYKYIHGHWPPKGQISPNAGKIIHAWENAFMGEDPAGIAAKLSDFFDSAYGRETRTWLRDAYASGPGVVDRWTLRSDGFLDHNSYSQAGEAAPNPNRIDEIKERRQELVAKGKTSGLTTREQRELNRLAKEEVDLNRQVREFYDMSGGPDHYQYEWSSIRLGELHQMFNEQAVHGRTDWAVDEVQALDWFAIRSEWGELGGGWDETFRSNMFSIVGEVVGDMRKEWLQEGARGAMITDVRTNGAHGTVEILGTTSQAAAIAQRLANESGRRSYHFYDTGGSPQRGTIVAQALDIVNQDSDLVFNTLAHEVQDMIDDGILVLPWGDGGLRIVFRDPDGKALPKKGKGSPAQRRDELVARLTPLGIEATPLTTRMEVFHASRPSYSLYRGNDPRGILARAAAARRRRSEFRVSEVVGRDGAERFVAGLANNSRAFSLSPRAVEDFLEGGYRGFLTDDGNAGAAISPSGEIVSVFNSNSFKGAGGHVLAEALAQGGFWLNAFDGFLPPYYANLGFREVARVPFSEKYAPPGWTYKHGRPDIVLMAYMPDHPIRRGRRYDSFEAAEARAIRMGQEGLSERSVESFLDELADRGDGAPHIAENGKVLTQWKRTITVGEGDPVIQGAVRVTDEGVHIVLTPASNFSTLVHENAHAVLRGTLEWLEQGNDPRLEPVLAKLGIDALDDISTRSQELWARAVEYHAYLGSMPAPQLRQLLADTSKLMHESYRAGLRQLAGDEFDVDTITDLLTDSNFTTLLDDLVNITYGTTRQADAVFMPRLGPQSPNGVVRVMRRVGSSMTRGAITPPRRSPVGKGNQNIRFESGEYRYGPDVIADYATSAFRHGVATELARDIFHESYVKPLVRDETTGRWTLPEDHVPFVYKTTPGASRLLDEQLGLTAREKDLYEPGAPDDAADLEPQELAEKIRDETATAFAQVFPELGSFDRHALDQLVADKAIVAIPKHVHLAYMDAVTGTTLLSTASKFYARDFGPVGKAIGTPFAVFNFFARWNMIGKFAYATTNTVGAVATATLHNPFWVGEIKKMTDWSSNWSPAALRMLDEMVGAGTLEVARLLEEESAVTRIGQREREAFVKVQEGLSYPERRIRRALMVRELHAAGYVTEADFLRLRELAGQDPKYQAIFNQLARNAEDGAIRFRGMSDGEKWIVRRAFFVYGWLRASFRYTMRFPVNHPILAAVMNRIGNEGWEEMQDALEREIGFRGGLPIKMTETEEGRIARLVDLSSIFPFASGMEVARSLAAPELALAGYFLDANSIGDMFSPGVEFGVALALGETPRHLTPKALLKEYGPGEGFAGVPLLNWIVRIADPKHTESTTFAARSRTDVAAAFILGQLWPRDTKLDAAQEQWLKRQPVSIAAPIRVQQELDKMSELYAQAAKADGAGPVQEWLTALDARAAYELTTSLKEKQWKDLDQADRDLERAKVKAQTLKQFYPDAYSDLQSLPDDLTAEEVVTEVDSVYNDWVGSAYSDMRAYIEDLLGEEALADA